MRKYSRLYEFINYFKDTNRVFCTWKSENPTDDQIILGYPVYSKELENFISEIYKSDLLKSDYLPYLYSLKEADYLLRIICTEEIKEYIEKAEFETIRAILTFYIRQQRFNEGIWESVAKKGIVYKLLTRIKELNDK